MVEDELFLECVKQAWGIRGDIKKEDLKKITASWVNRNKIRLSHPEKGKEYALGLWQTFLRKFGKTLKLGSLQVRLRVAKIYGFVDLIEGILEEIKMAQSEKQERENKKNQEEPFPIERVMEEDELFLECVKQALGIKGEIKKEDLMNITTNRNNKNKIKLSHLEEGKEYALGLWEAFLKEFGETQRLGSLQVRLRVAKICGFEDLIAGILEEIKMAQSKKQKEPFPIERAIKDDELFLACVKQALGIERELRREDLMRISSTFKNKNEIKLSHPEEGKEYASYLWTSFIRKFGEMRKLGSLLVRLRVAKICKFEDKVVEIQQLITQEEAIQALDHKKPQEILDENKDILADISGMLGRGAVAEYLVASNPVFAKMGIKRTLGILKDYLGSFLPPMRPIPRDKIVSEDILKIESLYDLVYRQWCDAYFPLMHKNEDETIEILKNLSGHYEKEYPLFAKMLYQVQEYYLDVYSIPKPSNFVDSLKKGRNFPDMNQRRAMKEIAEKRRMLIADDMGTGKSASAILGKEYVGANKALIVCPDGDVALQWVRNIKFNYFKADNQPKVGMIHAGMAPSDWEQVKDADYVVMGFSMFMGKGEDGEEMVETLKKLGFDYLVVDEAHNAKNIKGTWVRIIQELSLNTDSIRDGYTVLLSGTPIPNRIQDITPTLRLLEPEMFRDKTDEQILHMIKTSHPLLIRDILKKRMLRHSATEVLNLPELDYQEIIYNLRDVEVLIYQAMLEEDGIFPAQKINILQQLVLDPKYVDLAPYMDSSKYQNVQSYLDDELTRTDKVIIFVNQFRDGLTSDFKDLDGDCLFKKLQRHYEKQGIKVLKRDGNDFVEGIDRQQILKECKESNQKVIFLATGKTTSEGMQDLVCFDSMVLYNLPWTEALKFQQIARLHREGQQNSVKVRSFIAENTIEEGIRILLAEKQRIIDMILEGNIVDEEEWDVLERQSRYDRHANIEGYVHTTQQKLAFMFNCMFGKGSALNRKYLEKRLYPEDPNRTDTYGDLYAKLYKINLVNSYYANNGRTNAEIMRKLIVESGNAGKMEIADLGSANRVLQHYMGRSENYVIKNVDINSSHFDEVQENDVVADFRSLPFEDGSKDLINMSLALHYTSLAITEKNYERVDVLNEINRVLKVGGCAIVSFPYGSIKPEQFENLKEEIRNFGFDVIAKYTGVIESSDGEKGQKFRSYTLSLKKVGSPKDIKEIDLTKLRMSKVKESDNVERNLSGGYHTSFNLNGINLNYQSSLEDELLYQRYLHSQTEKLFTSSLIQKLVQQYSDPSLIPDGVLLEYGLRRLGLEADKVKNYTFIKEDGLSAGVCFKVNGLNVAVSDVGHLSS